MKKIVLLILLIIISGCSQKTKIIKVHKKIIKSNLKCIEFDINNKKELITILKNNEKRILVYIDDFIFTKNKIELTTICFKEKKD